MFGTLLVEPRHALASQLKFEMERHEGEGLRAFPVHLVFCEWCEM